ncbi:MAG: hypothetical protein ACK559_18820, partial [bacterium]
MVRNAQTLVGTGERGVKVAPSLTAAGRSFARVPSGRRDAGQEGRDLAAQGLALPRQRACRLEDIHGGLAGFADRTRLPAHALREAIGAV